MGIFYALKKMKRMIDAGEVIQNQMTSNPGLFAGNPGEFSNFAVKNAESRWKNLFEVLERYDFLPNAQVWAACGVASALPTDANRSELLKGPKFTAGYEFTLILLCKLLEDIEYDFRLKSTLSDIESELLSEAATVRDNALQRLNQQ